MPDMKPEELIRSGAAGLGIQISDEQLAAFITYLKELKRWNARINLTAVRGDREIITRHFLDSLAGLKVISPRIEESPETPLAAMDIGAGAGFPGLPIRICRPQIRLTLLEPRQKKASFLHFICGQLGLQDVLILTERFERIVSTEPYRGSFDLLLTRALRRSEFLSQSPSLLRPGGQMILWSTERQVAQAAGAWEGSKQIDYRLPFSQRRGRLLVLTRRDGRSRT